jgi:hypothetical protein
MKTNTQSHERNKPGETSMLIWNVPVKVKTAFKKACAQREIPMKDAIIKFMRRFTANVRH